MESMHVGSVDRRDIRAKMIGANGQADE